MRKQFFFIMVTVLFSLPLLAGEGEFAVAKISPALLKNANVVKRYGETRYEISSYAKMKVYERNVITVLNENGDEFAGLVEFYDKFRNIKSIEGKIYDAAGKQIKSLKPKDIEDRSAVSEISLMEDSRVKVHHFYHRIYPYTVEYEVVTEFNTTFLFPQWLPQPAEKFSVEKSSIQVVVPDGFTFRYKMFNYTGVPSVTPVKEGTQYAWEVSNLPAVLKEYAAPEWPNLTTCIYFSPDKFEFGGFKGSMDSWDALGQFQLQLNLGRDKLPDAVKQKVHWLTDGILDIKEKIRILYEYLQKNTRYVSIQLGIGGLQPFDASYVAAKAYGDCKALSNYMFALLKEANIKSCYTQIKSGEGKYFFLPDFPSDQFNHIILCVPLVKDTMWLECTSQTLPAGYLSGFTCNRPALVIDENGGHLVTTPRYGIKENFQQRNIKATLNDEGTLQVNAITSYGGLQQDDIHGLINNLSKDKVKEYLHEQLDFATYDISNFSYTENKTALPSINETLDIEVTNYATITGKRLFITPNVMTRASRKLLADEERKYEVVFTFEYRDVDSVEITIPAGYTPESMPQEVTISNKFGKYKGSVKLTGNKLFYYRSIERYAGHFSAKEYNDLVKFYEAIYKADRSKVVLVKQEGTKGF